MSVLLAQLVACLLAALFAVAALAKLDAWRAWRLSAEAVATRSYGGSAAGGTVLGGTLAGGVILVELGVVAMLLLLPAQGLIAASLAFTLLAVGVLVAQRRAVGTTCNCFGSLWTSRFEPRLAVRNMVFAGAALAAFLLFPEPPRVPAPGVLTVWVAVLGWWCIAAHIAARDHDLLSSARGS